MSKRKTLAGNDTGNRFVTNVSLAPILETARKMHVLTISDRKRFDRSGGMILLFKYGDMIRFSINRALRNAPGSDSERSQ